MNNNLISIIMNCYNGEEFIKRAVNSIVNQTYQNWELIFWDNNSTDNSSKILKSFSDKRIKYFFSNKYEKLYKARNLALKMAKGNFISFLDVDDTWENKKLELQLNDMIIKKADVSFTNYWEHSKNKKKIFKKTLNSNNIHHQILNNYPIGILTVLMKSDIFFEKKLSFDENFEIIGDFDLFFKLSKSYNFCSISEPLATYYIHDNNLSIKKLDLEIEEFDKWILKNKEKLFTSKNNILDNQNLRICNFLFKKKKLYINSLEIKKISKLKIRFKFYLKLILQKLKIL